MDGAAPDTDDVEVAVAPTFAVEPTSPAAAAARGRAAAFVTAYARPAGPGRQAQWWASVVPFLSAQAALDYEGVLASRVPYTRVTGASRQLPLGDGSVQVVLVEVPTDAGPVGVHLVPAVPGDDRGWVVTRAEMPAARPAAASTSIVAGR